MSRVLVPLAAGFEEIEAVTLVDLLRRAGIEVHTAALSGHAVTGSHGITLTADIALDAAHVADYDMIVLPGGLPGADHLKADARVISLLRRFAADGRYTAAICAAPGVLAHAGLLEGRAATSYPGFLTPDSAPGLRLSEEAVVVDGKVATSRGPGTAMEFGLALIELLQGADARRRVQEKLQMAGEGDRG
jgi:4-methyl-5(b-hydroxyethyl)-thiazole monophosphate biosynthesis